jgi:ABC-2 type transport system permease protein
MSRAGVAKYTALAGASARRTLGARAELLVRSAFLGLILFIFSRLWAVVLARGTATGAGTAELIWYLAVTEWCVLSIPAIFLVIERDVRSGDVACQLVRPISYVGARLAEAFGEAAVRLLVLAPAAAAAAWLFAGTLPPNPSGLLLAPPLVALSSVLAVLFVTAIGLSAVWIVDTSPMMWVWQKLLFVLGGLMLPLELYPGWLRAIAHWSPFSAMLWGPGRTSFGWAPGHAVETGCTLAAWSVALALALAWLDRRARARLTVHGG